MQARPVPQRLTTVFRDRNVLNCSSSRPSRRTALTQTPSRNSSSQQAPPSSPCDERTKYTNDGYTTYRNRTSASNESSRPLPLPPLMDPIALSARERWTEPKKPAPTKKEDLTPFQRKLYANPFAHALATPIRLDRTTATHQPAFHHLVLHAHAHPETSQPHLLPTHLHAAALPSSKKPAHSTPAPTPSAYFLLRAPLLHLLTTSRGQRWRSAINLRVHDKTQGNLAWRPDMPDHVRALLQRIVFRRLQWCFSKPNGGGMLAGIPPPNNNDEPLTSRLGNEAGAVLFLRRVVRREVRDAEQRVRGALEAGDDLVDHLVKVGEAARRALKEKPLPRAGWGVWETGGPRLHPGVLYAPLKYPSVGYKAEGESGKEGGVEREIPVYDLVELLGEEMLAALLGGTAWEGEQAVVLKEKETTIGAHHALMQLQDYVIESV